MKVLLLFLDMLRANLLKLCNDKIVLEGPIEGMLKEIGGTIFTNCYTPAPDTPRGLACFYTGLYPNNNGCITRIQWPKYYLMNDKKTIFDIFLENNYEIITKVQESEYKVGVFPDNVEDKIKTFFDFNKYLDVLKKAVKENDKIFTMVDFPDYHMALDDYGGTPAGDFFGQKRLASSLSRFFNEIDIDVFDIIIVFSDHGCKLDKEKHKVPKIFLIDDDRSKIYMQIRKKNEKDIKINNNLQSLMGVFPFLADEIDYKIDYKLDGKHIIKESMESVLIEDHSKFEPSIGNFIDLWGLRTKDNFYLKSINDEKLYKIEKNNYYLVGDNHDKEKGELEEIISKSSCSFNDVLKQAEILKSYRDMKISNELYSDDTPRIKYDKPNWIERLLSGIIIIMTSLLNKVIGLTIIIRKLSLNSKRYIRW